MQFPLALLTAALAAITSAAAVPALSSACTGGSYDACTSDTMCIQMFPESCYCQKAASERCATSCGTTAPTMICPPKEPVNDACEPKVCTMQWPESCHCQVDQKKECAVSKGQAFNEKKERKKCGARRSEPKPATNPCEPKACIKSWPAGCHCEVDQKRDCALTQGLPWDDAKERARCTVTV